jgi:exosortase/archaeosortase
MVSSKMAAYVGGEEATHSEAQRRIAAYVAKIVFVFNLNLVREMLI